MLQAALLDKLPEIIALFKENKVARAFAFGSVCTFIYSKNPDFFKRLHFRQKNHPKTQ